MSKLSMSSKTLQNNPHKTCLYFEACSLNCRHDRVRALDILVNDLKAFAISNDELYKEMAQLLTLDDFRYGILC